MTENLKISHLFRTNIELQIDNEERSSIESDRWWSKDGVQAAERRRDPEKVRSVDFSLSCFLNRAKNIRAGPTFWSLISCIFFTIPGCVAHTCSVTARRKDEIRDEKKRIEEKVERKKPEDE